MIALVLALLAGQPAVLAGQVVTHDASRDLAATLDGLIRAATDASWIGYEVPAPDGAHVCWEGDDLGTRRDGITRLEPSGRLQILLRVEGGTVTRVRLSSPECRLDTGGRPLHWLIAAAPAESVTLLNGLATRRDAPRALANGALAALALHAEPAALERLLALAHDGASAPLRGQALFWLAQRAGDRAVGAITRAIADDPDTSVKRQAVFALSQLPAAEGVPRLIDVARTHSNAAVRKQAFFWLGQSQDPRALAFFEEILRR